MPENRMNQSYCLADQRDSFRKWFCRALLAIAQDGVPQVAQLRADLVFASRQQLDRQLGRSSRGWILARELHRAGVSKLADLTASRHFDSRDGDLGLADLDLRPIEAEPASVPARERILTWPAGAASMRRRHRA